MILIRGDRLLGQQGKFATCKVSYYLVARSPHGMLGTHGVTLCHATEGAVRRLSEWHSPIAWHPFCGRHSGHFCGYIGHVGRVHSAKVLITSGPIKGVPSARPLDLCEKYTSD